MLLILVYVAASKTIDFLLHGIEEYTAITIVSAEDERIKAAITNGLHCGFTFYKGHGELGGKRTSSGEREILYRVETRLEIGNVKNVVGQIDPTAFITTHSVSDVEGV